MRKKFLFLAGVLSLGIIVLLTVFVFKKDNKKAIVKLNASVNYDFESKKFEIKNTDTIDFVHADIVIDKYYKLRNYNLKAGETYSIWQVEFLHHNGIHYPGKRRPSHFSIWCEINDERNGFFSKKLN